MRIKDLNEEPTKREIEKAEQDARILAQLRGTAKKDSFYDDPSRFISPDRKHKLIHDPEKNVAITKGPSGKKTSGDHAFSGIHNVTPVPTTGPGAAETSTVTSTNPASQAATQHGQHTREHLDTHQRLMQKEKAKAQARLWHNRRLYMILLKYMQIKSLLEYQNLTLNQRLNQRQILLCKLKQSIWPQKMQNVRS